MSLLGSSHGTPAGTTSDAAYPAHEAGGLQPPPPAECPMEALYLVCGARRSQLMRDSLGGGMPMSERIPRELPSSSRFSTPRVQSLAGARYCLQLLEEQAAIVASRAAELRAANQNDDLAYIDGALERQALSEALQVLAAMTAEGAVNLLGILILGDADFYTSLERKPILEKLSQLLSTI